MNGHYSPSYSRQQEKAELQHLAGRMQSYLGKVKELRQAANQVDSSALINSVRLLEDEVDQVKSVYEKELLDTRRQLQQERAAMAEARATAHRNDQMAQDLKNRLELECQRNRALHGEAEEAHKMAAIKEMDLQQVQAKCNDLVRRARTLEDDATALRKENEKLQRELDRERVARQEAEDTQAALKRKQEFDAQIHLGQCKEHQRRLEDDADRILQLEKRIRELATPDTNLHEALEEMRRATERELEQYKDQTEAEYHRNLQELKDDMDRDSENMERVVNENRHLEAEMERLNGELSAAQTQLRNAEKQNTQLADTLRDERSKNTAHVQALEDKLRMLQDRLVQKMHDITIATDAKQPIRSELESLKAMLDEEERKLNHEIASTSPRPHSSPTQIARPMTTGSTSTRTPPNSLKSRSRERPSSVPVTMGQGRDYFDSIFTDLTQSGTITIPPVSRPSTVSTHDYTTATSSTTGELKILEVSEDGKFVRLFNTGPDTVIGGFTIQQNVGGHPVAVYRFEPRTRMKSGGVVTIWSASSRAKHQPPTDFLWKEQHRWGTGPECTTILCRPNGHAVAWTTAAHRFSKAAEGYNSKGEASDNSSENSLEGSTNPHPEYEVHVDGKPTTVLKREKQTPRYLSPTKNPHGQNTHQDTHPATAEMRVKNLGNDGCSSMQQSRSQNPLPDSSPVSTRRAAGASRTGSAPLRLSASRPSSSTSQGSIRYSARPNLFLPRYSQDKINMDIIRSKQHVSFKPPMPKPAYSISSW